MTTPLLWTVAQAAEEMQLSQAHLYRLTRENRIPFVRVGRSVRFSPDALRDWVSGKQNRAVT